MAWLAALKPIVQPAPAPAPLEKPTVSLSTFNTKDTLKSSASLPSLFGEKPKTGGSLASLSASLEARGQLPIVKVVPDPQIVDQNDFQRKVTNTDAYDDPIDEAQNHMTSVLIAVPIIAVVTVGAFILMFR